MIRLNVFIRTSADNRDELLRTALELVTASLRDEGCIAYDLFESTTRPDTLMICETWRDAAALDDHGRQPHFVALVPRLRALGDMKTEKFVY